MLTRKLVLCIISIIILFCSGCSILGNNVEATEESNILSKNKVEETLDGLNLPYEQERSGYPLSKIEGSHNVDEIFIKENRSNHQVEIPSEVKPKQVALTFDDGPHRDVTPLILDALKEKGAKATFFVIGSSVDLYPDIMMRIVEEGHEIGNHTWGHTDLTKLTRSEIKDEIYLTQQAIERTTGVTPTLMRPPFGTYNQFMAEMIPLPIIMWSIDSRDWKTRHKETIAQDVLSDVEDGSIVLFHDIYYSTYEALIEIINHLEVEGYDFVTVTQLLQEGDDTETLHTGKVYSVKRKM
ncbi:MAG: polysaccharide deacetylase family protein [Bacillaceae bacterium]|nr:polysaccharide deacetylase family protein [Bacillaceae bacterium]